ncbi:MAG: TIGR01777 family protein [Bacteroidia bacterium]|nr:TIGR01777 family protein [Bacteroidia bacterium]
MSKILIAGGSGMIGSKLILKLKQNNIDFVFLSTQKNTNYLKNSYHWDPEKDIFPSIDLKEFDAVVNFCGAGIFDKAFSPERKKTLLSSRILPIEALNKAFKRQNIKAPIFISASASGYYSNDSQEIIDENSPSGTGFIAELVKKWETAIFSSSSISDRICAIRIGIVLSNTGGFLKPMAQTINRYVGAVPGSGKQMVSWIHVDDLCEMILFAIKNKLEGVYNGTNNHPVNLSQITHQFAQQLHKPLILPNIPTFILRLIFGKERHQLILTNQNITPKRMLDAGFKYEFDTIEKALKNLYP